MPNARFVEAHGILEWRLTPERLNREAVEFVEQCWGDSEPDRRTGS